MLQIQQQYSIPGQHSKISETSSEVFHYGKGNPHRFFDDTHVVKPQFQLPASKLDFPLREARRQEILRGRRNRQSSVSKLNLNIVPYLQGTFV